MSYFYKDKTPLLWYKDNIAKFVEIFGEKQFLLWSNRNYRWVLGKDGKKNKDYRDCKDSKENKDFKDGKYHSGFGWYRDGEGY